MIAIAPMPMAAEGLVKTAAAEATRSMSPASMDAYALEQYEKILRFQDAILSGKHATIKVPTLAEDVAAASIPSLVASSTSGAAKGNPLAVRQHYGAVSAQSLPDKSSEFNPVLLEKSDELIRAEIHLQRQRLERALREEVDERRASRHAQADHLADLDPSAILAEALTIVQETAPPAQSNEDTNATNGAESDSVDNNTFYSSQHDTNESRLTSVVRNRSADAEGQDAALQGAASVPRADITNTNIAHKGQSSHTDAQQKQPSDPYSPPTASSAPQSVVPGLNNYTGSTAFASASQALAGSASGRTNVASGGYATVCSKPIIPGITPAQPDSYAKVHPPSPLLQSQARAAAPTQSSQQGTAFDVAAAHLGQYYGSSHATVGTPAKVAALRSGPTSVTSPDSSSQGGRTSDKKKGKQKKKKRKSDRQGVDTDMPYIKPEPRSPSPLPGPSYIRPNKRQRQANAQPEPAGYDDMAYDPTMPSGPSDYYQQVYRPGQTSTAFGASGPDASQSSSRDRAVPYGSERLDRDPRPPYTIIRPLPEYAHRESHPSGPPTSHQDAHREMPRPYNEPAPVRYSAWPEGEAHPHQGSAGPQPVRILVDSYGREYIDPPRQHIRHSVAPSPMAGEPDSIYERPAVRVLSRYGGAPSQEERVMYARPSSPYGGQQRVISQPEYVSYDYRDNRYREYSARPAAGPTEYVQVRKPAEQIIYLDSPRQYIGRAASTRPMDPAAASLPAPEYHRVQSVRPEPSGVTYGAQQLGSQGFGPYNTWPGQPTAEGENSGHGGHNQSGPARSVPGPIYMQDNARRDMYR